MRFGRAHVASLALVALLVGFGACSLDNQEGPDVTCEELGCGRINACANGIIAQCVDGKTIKYRVCAADDNCSADWQIDGQFRCSEDQTDCEGCRPERAGCDDVPSDGGGGAAPASGGGGA